MSILLFLGLTGICMSVLAAIWYYESLTISTGGNNEYIKAECIADELMVIIDDIEHIKEDVDQLKEEIEKELGLSYTSNGRLKEKFPNMVNLCPATRTKGYDSFECLAKKIVEMQKEIDALKKDRAPKRRTKKSSS